MNNKKANCLFYIVSKELIVKKKNENISFKLFFLYSIIKSSVIYYLISLFVCIENLEGFIQLKKNEKKFNHQEYFSKSYCGLI